MASQHGFGAGDPEDASQRHHAFANPQFAATCTILARTCVLGATLARDLLESV